MDASPTSSRYADLRSAALPSQRVASELHKYNAKLAKSTHKPLRNSSFNSAIATPMPHWSNTKVIPLTNPSPQDPRIPVEALNKKDIWHTSQFTSDGSKFRKHHSHRAERAFWDRDTSGDNALRLRYAVGDRVDLSESLEASSHSLELDPSNLSSMAPSYAAAILAPRADLAREVTVLRGKETADTLVDGALRKWRTDRKKGAEKLGWTVVLDGADGEGAFYEGEGDEEWEVLSN